MTIVALRPEWNAAVIDERARRATKTVRLATVLGMAVAAVHVWFLRGLTVDDAAITFDYAHRAAQGYPLGTATPGRPLVEGYSNFTWTGLLAVVDHLGVRPETAAKWLGGCFAALTVAVVVATVVPLIANRRWVFGVAAVGASTTFAMWAASGLENGLFSLLLAAGVCLLVREERRGATGVRSCGSAVVFALVALSRPEGWIYLVAALLAKALSVRRTGRTGRTDWTGRTRLVDVASWAAVGGGAMALYLAWHERHFGVLLPNTAYAKAVSYGPATLVRQVLDPHSSGWQYVVGWLSGHMVMALIPLALIGVAAVRRSPGQPIAIIAAATFALPMVDPDWMAGYRFLSWTVPLFVALAVIGADQLAGLTMPGRMSRKIGIAAVGLLAVFGVTNVAVSIGQRHDHYADQVTAAKVATTYQPLVAATQRFGLHDPLSMLPDIGAPLRVLDMRVLDSAGLADAEVAHSRNAVEQLQHYAFVEQRPELVHTHGLFTQMWGLDWATMARFGYLPLREWRDQYGEHGDFIRKDTFVSTSPSPATSFQLVGADPPVESSEHRSLDVDVRWANGGQGQVSASAAQTVRLVDGDGRVVTMSSDELGYGIYPPDQWAATDVVRQHTSLPLPAGVRPGHYQLVVDSGSVRQAIGVDLPIEPSASSAQVARSKRAELLDQVRTAATRLDADPVESLSHEVADARGRAATSPEERAEAGHLLAAAKRQSVARRFALVEAAMTLDPDNDRAQLTLVDARKALLARP